MTRGPITLRRAPASADGRLRAIRVRSGRAAGAALTRLALALIALVTLIGAARPARAEPPSGAAPLVVASGSRGGAVSASIGAVSGPSLDAEAAPTDNPSWLALPFVFFSPETSLAFGAAGGLYWRLAPTDRPSSLQASATYTVRHQAIVSAILELFILDDTLRLWSVLTFSRFPDRFYGVGADTPDAAEERFSSTITYARGGAQYELGGGLRAGPRYHLHREALTETEADGSLAALAAERPVYLASGLGLGLAWDTRDSLFSPSQGVLFEGTALWYRPWLGSDDAFSAYTLDLRGFVPLLWPRHVLALQGVLRAATGDVPVLLTPEVGGQDVLRGYFEGRYRDRRVVTLQAEYRFPAWWRLGGVVFGAVGDVGPSMARVVDLEQLRAAGGLGLRVRVNDEGVNLRADVAFSPQGPAAYITVTEAF